MKQLLPSFTPSTLLIIITFLITIHTTGATNLINSTCKSFVKIDPNIDYGFCTTTLQSSNASRCSTLQCLGSVSIDLLHRNVSDTRCFIDHLVGNRTADNNRYLRQCLDDCLELFSDAVASVEEAKRYYCERKFDDANVEISSIMEAASTCEDGFKERRGVASPLTKRNGDVFQLSALALSAMHMIQTRRL